MHFSIPLTTLLTLLPSLSFAAPQYPETIYLANCGTSYSTMDFYAEGHTSFDMSWPNDRCKMSGSGTTWWEGVSRSCAFGDVTFTSHIDADAASKASHAVVGWGKNKYHEYTCRKEEGYRILYKRDGLECRSVYYCTWQV